MTDVYKEFDTNCCQEGLSEVFKTASKSTYFWMRKTLEEKNVRFLGFGDDYNCNFEIRFSVH